MVTPRLTGASRRGRLFEQWAAIDGQLAANRARAAIARVDLGSPPLLGWAVI